MYKKDKKYRFNLRLTYDDLDSITYNANLFNLSRSEYLLRSDKFVNQYYRYLKHSCTYDISKVFFEIFDNLK